MSDNPWRTSAYNCSWYRDDSGNFRNLNLNFKLNFEYKIFFPKVTGSPRKMVLLHPEEKFCDKFRLPTSNIRHRKVPLKQEANYQITSENL